MDVEVAFYARNRSAHRSALPSCERQPQLPSKTAASACGYEKSAAVVFTLLVSYLLTTTVWAATISLVTASVSAASTSLDPMYIHWVISKIGSKMAQL